MIKLQNAEMTAGDRRQFDFTVDGGQSAPMVSPTAIWFIGDAAPLDNAELPAISKAASPELIAGSWVFSVILEKTDTASMIGTFPHQLRVTDAETGVDEVVTSGDLTIKPRIGALP